jgi:hypothetical protein
MTSLLIATVVAVFPLHVLAQSDNWTSVRALPKGTDLIIERKNDDRVIGTLASVSDDTIAITSEDGSFFVGRGNVTKVHYAVSRNVKRHLVRGLVLGMVIGTAVAGAFASEENDRDLTLGAVGFWIGMGVGGYIVQKRGESKKKGELIYAAR